MHYKRQAKHGDPNVVTEMVPLDGPCLVAGCPRQRQARGYCSTHYKRWWKHGDPSMVLPKSGPPRADPVPCTATGCDRQQEALGYCVAHYARFRKRGTVRADVPVGDLNRCSVCTSTSSRLIDADLLSGGICREVGERWGYTMPTIYHHLTQCLGAPTGRACSVCAHPDLDDIDGLLRATRRVPGKWNRPAVPVKEIAALYQLRRGPLASHAAKHLDNEEYLMKQAVKEIRRLAAVKRRFPQLQENP
jgi:hypothetical protein